MTQFTPRYNPVEHLRAILQTVIDGIITINNKGIIQTVNPAASRIFGYTEQEMLGQNVKMLMPVEYATEHDKYINNYLETGDNKVIGIGREVIGQRKDGSVFPLELAVSEMTVDGQLMFTGIVRDISERKETENNLRNSEARIRAIVDTVIDGIVTINSQGLIQTFNPAAQKIFGYTTEEVTGRNVSMLMPQPYADAHDTYMNNYLTTGNKKIIGIGREVTGLRKDGSTFPMELAVSEMMVDDQRMFTGIVRDITERKRLDKMKNEFISTVSHELRTPLTSIRGALNLVLGKAGDSLSGKPKRMLEMAERNSERLTLLINDILDLEKIQSGQLVFNFKPLDLVALTKRALDENEGYARTHSVKLVMNCELEQAPVYADENRLLQVYANLISNAIKYSPTDGTVEVILNEHDNCYRVTVKDHGSGIPEEFRNRIFQRFAQADSSDTREKGGTGLGLSITKAIVERHEGNIGYETKTGKGTQFYFDLRRSAYDFVRMHDNTTTQAVRRVLICEDNQDVATVLAEMISTDDIACDIAGTVAATRKLLADHKYNLLLLDLILPDGDGLDLINEMRLNPKTAEIPIIVVSARASENENRFEGDVVAVVDWLQKPFDQQRLLHAIQDAMHISNKPHILHVEDDPDVVQVVKLLLEDSADYTYASSLSEARNILQRRHFDLVLLDLALSDGSGIELLDEIKKCCPVIIFSGDSARKEDIARVNAALTKSVTTNDELLGIIRSTLRRITNDG